MAIGAASGMEIYDAEFQSGVVEVLAQSTNAFNAASRNAIVLGSELLKGEYNKEAFFDLNATLVERRDLTDVSTETDDDLSQGEIIGVKVSRRAQTANTLDSLRKVQADEREMSFVLGQQYAKAKLANMLNTGCSALAGTLLHESNALYDATATADTGLTHKNLVKGLAKMGDGQGRIVAWIMHSASQFQLMENSIESAALLDSVAGAFINSGNIASLNRPMIVTDSTALYSDTDYYVVGLTEQGLRLVESEQESVVGEVVTGYHNLLFRVQGEFSYNVTVKGFAYDSTANPTDATLAGDNWTTAVTSVKDCAGIIIKHTIE
jgi:hypothetical protein